MEKLKILVVDDEARMRKLVKDFLTKDNFEVVEAEDGSQALDIFYEQKDIALIILDVMMPKMDGFKMAKEIRKLSPIVPLLFLTAKSTIDDIEEGFEIGANDYLKKPFELRELIVRIKALLRRANRQEEIKYD